MTSPAQDSEHLYRQGIEHLDAGQLERARACFVQVVAAAPRHARAQNNLGIVLQWHGQDEDAEACYRAALEAEPALAQAWFNLGTLLQQHGAAQEALQCLERSVALDPVQAEWHALLAVARAVAGQAQPALQAIREAARLAPENAAFQEQLGNHLLEAGEPAAAIVAFRRAIEIEPGLSSAHSRLICALDGTESVAHAIAAWQRTCVRATATRHENEPSPERRLRIGYLAPDFGEPAIAGFIGPLLAAHDRARFEVACYSDAGTGSPASARLRATAALWHACAELDDRQLGERIRDDGIDALVDLGGHRGGGRRAPLVASQLAPVQLSWPDVPRDAKGLEDAVRSQWRSWCATQTPRASAGADPSPLPPARVVVDGVFFQEHATGIGRVWRTVLAEWVKSGFARNVILLDRDGTAPPIEGLRARRIARHSAARHADDRALLQRACDEEGAQVFISTYYTQPQSTPAVMMLYDMIPEVLGYDLALPEWREKRACIESARRYVSISRSSARDLRGVHPSIAAGRISVAHPAAEPHFRPAAPAEVAEFRARHGISRPYFLAVGARDSHYKNGRVLFRAFERLPGRARRGVLCVGGEQEIPAYARRACEGAELKLLRLDDEELRLAYAGAIALVYPSLHEGFGMPVVEAMACGCPVITTSRASLPEVAGGAALYVGATDVAGLAAAMEWVQRPEFRAPLIERGLERARQFSWTRMADEVARVLAEVAAGKEAGAASAA